MCWQGDITNESEKSGNGEECSMVQSRGKWQVVVKMVVKLLVP